MPQPYVYAAAVSNTPGKRPYSRANLASAHAAHKVTDPTVHGWHCFLYPDQISEQQKNKGKSKQALEALLGISRESMWLAHSGKIWNPLCRCTLLPTGSNVHGTALVAVRPGYATDSDSSLSPTSCHSFSSSSSDLATAEASLQQRSRSSPRPASFDAPTTLPPKRSLHLPRDRGSTHTLSRTPGRCPGPWQSRGRRRFGLVLVGRVGADSISFVFIFRVHRRIQKGSHVVPGPSAIVTIVTAGEQKAWSTS